MGPRCPRLSDMLGDHTLFSMFLPSDYKRVDGKGHYDGYERLPRCCGFLSGLIGTLIATVFVDVSLYEEDLCHYKRASDEVCQNFGRPVDGTWEASGAIPVDVNEKCGDDLSGCLPPETSGGSVQLACQREQIRDAAGEYPVPARIRSLNSESQFVSCNWDGPTGTTGCLDYRTTRGGCRSACLDSSTPTFDEELGDYVCCDPSNICTKAPIECIPFRSLGVSDFSGTFERCERSCDLSNVGLRYYDMRRTCSCVGGKGGHLSTDCNCDPSKGKVYGCTDTCVRGKECSDTGDANKLGGTKLFVVRVVLGAVLGRAADLVSGTAFFRWSRHRNSKCCGCPSLVFRLISWIWVTVGSLAFGGFLLHITEGTYSDGKPNPMGPVFRQLPMEWFVWEWVETAMMCLLGCHDMKLGPAGKQAEVDDDPDVVTVSNPVDAD